MKRKVCVVVTARPSYSRIKTALKAIESHPDLDLQLVVAASALLDRYGSVVEEIVKDGFQIERRVFMVLEGESPLSMAKTTGLGVMELANVFDSLTPDIVVTIADRYETISTAIAASYLNIPLAHIQGGEITGSIDEKVRHAITKLADIHLVASKLAGERVVRMGEEGHRVFVTGCPSIDLAHEVLISPQLDFCPFEKYGGVGASIDLKAGYLVVMHHPVTTEFQLSNKHVKETLSAVMGLGRPVLWFWPNVDAGSDGIAGGVRAFREKNPAAPIHLFKSMAPKDFLKVICNCDCLVGNSSVGIREASYLGVPVVNIGTRQLGRERGENVIDAAYDHVEISKAIHAQINNKEKKTSNIYGNGDAGILIAKVLAEVPLTYEKKLAY